MRKVLIVVENPALMRPLTNFFIYLKLPVKVGSTHTSKFQMGISEVIILDAHTRIERLPSLIQSIRSKFPDLQIACLIRGKGSRITGTIDKRQRHVFLKTQDLMRIYKRVKQLRGSALKRKKVSHRNA